MPVQDIRIKYLVDNIELIETDKILGGISKEEEEVAKNATKMSTAIKKSSTESQKSVNDLNGSIKAIGATIIAAFTVDKILAFGSEVVRVRGEFQKLEAVLTNTLGSQSKAQAALGQIKDFAAKTNFSVLELTTSFVKLANQGFVPTTNELRKLADLANSTGKNFDQLTEAIIDAQTGEFERLKEFGIRASKEGDKVTFAFKGVKTQTDFTNQSIRDYILSLGDLNGVSGATEAISKTLGGQVSNLGDAWDNLLNTIGERSEGVLVGTLSLLNDAIMAANELLTTEDDKRIQSNKALLNNLIKDDQEALSTLTEMYEYAGLERKEAQRRALVDMSVQLMMERATLIQNGKDLNNAYVKQYTERIDAIDDVMQQQQEKELTAEKEKAEKLRAEREKQQKIDDEKERKAKIKSLKEINKIVNEDNEFTGKERKEYDKKVADEILDDKREQVDETINLIEKQFKYEQGIANAKRNIYNQEQQALGNLSAFIRASFGESKELMFAAFLLEKIQAVSSVILNSATAQTAAIAASAQISTLNPILGEAYLAKQTAIINVNKALQLGTIGALTIGEATQTFAKGGYTGDERGHIDHTGEMIAGIVHKKEFVFDRNKTSRFRPLFEAIHRGELTENDIVIKSNNTNSFDYTQMASAYKQALKGQTKADIHLDERGFTKYMVSESKRQEVRNKRYSSK